MICYLCRQLGYEKEMKVERGSLDHQKGHVWLRCDGTHPDPASTVDRQGNTVKSIHTPRVEEVSLDDFDQLEET